MASLTGWTLLAAHVPPRSQTGHVARATLLNSGITKKTSGGSQHDGVKNGPICCWAKINGTSRGPGLCHRNSTAPAAAASQRLPIHPPHPLSHHALLSTPSPRPVLLDLCWTGRGVLMTFSSFWYLMSVCAIFLTLISSLEEAQKTFFWKSQEKKTCFLLNVQFFIYYCFHLCKSCRWNPGVEHLTSLLKVVLSNCMISGTLSELS